MSGGTFEYWQNQIEYVIESIKEKIQKSGKPIPERLWDWYMRQNPESRFGTEYSESALRRFEEAIYALEKAFIYTQRVDWLVACDDGEDSFEERLKEELEALDKRSCIGENGIRYIPVDRSVNPFDEDEDL